MSRRLSRRAFLEVAIAAAAASGVGVACVRNGTPWRFFTVDEARTLAAIADQIIPPDRDPGASWAGIVNYIDRQLCGPYQNLQKTYRHGLASVDQTCQSIYRKRFADLALNPQIALLQRLEAAQVPPELWRDVSATQFFQMVVDHAMQGYYGDPRHGGNRDAISWKMLGLPYPPIRGRMRAKLRKT